MQPINQLSCFLICPIGVPASDARKRSDKLLRYLITPVAERLKIQVIRADHIATPGVITDQIIRHLLEDDLVIADLSGSNPNVFYELAIRHVTRMPVIHIAEEGEALPFDNATMRTLNYSFDIDKTESFQLELSKMISSALQFPSAITTPFSMSTKMYLHSGELAQRIDPPGNKVTVFLDKSSMIQYFTEMYDKANEGDILWAQGIGHTAYPANLKNHLLKMAKRGVGFEIIINKNAPTGSEFLSLLNSVKTSRAVLATDSELRVQGLSEEEVLISLPTTDTYTAVVIRDRNLVKILRKWFVERFETLTKEK